MRGVPNWQIDVRIGGEWMHTQSPISAGSAARALDRATEIIVEHEWLALVPDGDSDAVRVRSSLVELIRAEKASR